MMLIRGQSPLTIARCRVATGLLLVLLCGLARAEKFPLPDPENAVVGAMGAVTARYEDTMLDVGRRHGLGYRDMVLANPDIDIWLPGLGTEIILPTHFVLPDAPRKGVVINLAEYRLYFFDPSTPGYVSTFPISIGKQDWNTPLGRTRIVRKQVKPTWYPPQSVIQEYAAEGRKLDPIVPPGPDNPLGDYAMRLSLTSYLIHGTNRPAGVGMRVTHGCIRMYPEDIDWLFPQVAVETPVTIINQPYKMGWINDVLMLEVHPPLVEDESIRERDLTPVMELYVQVTADRPAQMDWDKVDETFRQATGVPVAIGRGAPRAAESESVARVR